MTRVRGPARAVLRALICLGALLVLAQGIATAHPGMVGVERLDDDRVRAEFTAPLEETFALLSVRDRDGVVVSGPTVRDPRDPRALVAPLRADPGGGAVVEARVLSQDGHAERAVVGLAAGTSIGPADASVSSSARAVLIVVRGMALAGPLGALGLLVFWAWVVAPSVARGGIRPPGQPSRAGARAPIDWEQLEGSRRAWRRALVVALWVWGGGLLAVPGALLWSLGAGPGDLPDLLFHTRAGVAWWIQVAGLGVAVGVTLSAGRIAIERPGSVVPRLWTAALGPAAALGAISWAGHASSGPDRELNIAIDGVHNWATAAWLGGLVGLMAVLAPSLRGLSGGDRLPVAAAMVVRFSSLAVAAVAVLVITGVYRALAELNGAADLVATGYGQALTVKLAIFALLLVFATINRFVYHPRMERSALGLEGDDRGAAAALARSIRAEVAVGALLLAAVAVLIGLPPPR